MAVVDESAKGMRTVDDGHQALKNGKPDMTNSPPSDNNGHQGLTNSHQEMTKGRNFNNKTNSQAWYDKQTRTDTIQP